MNKSILIVYFSRPGGNYVNGQIVDLAIGNTEVVAGMILELTGGEIHRIEPVFQYSDDYDTCTQEAKKELKANARPALKKSFDTVDEFETILLCYPNWWGTMPMPVWTYLGSHDFSGKTILPLCTNEGSGMGSSERDIKELCTGARVIRGLAVQGGSVKKAGKNIESWLKSNGVL